MLLLAMIPIIVTSILILINLLVSKKSNFFFSKQTPFECGFNNITPSRSTFSIQFFFIALIFLIFDIEIAIILPFPFLLMNSMTMNFMIISIIVIILTMSLIYEWNKGLLKWFN
uniref:NADH-ubiquinone oxidoreductase chain 3 n=1 Tax=Argulus japonicus TaxID=873553 RepID=A0A7I8F094_9CRUS|nr:NADH dehydrogenase subunit 3 [Argulus japonicus]